MVILPGEPNTSNSPDSGVFFRSALASSFRVSNEKAGDCYRSERPVAEGQQTDTTRIVGMMDQGPSLF